MAKKKKIILLLSGGTSILDKSGQVFAVYDKSDIDVWLEQMPELNILADIEPILITSEDDIISPKTWEEMVKVIYDNLGRADGFIVVSQAGRLIDTSLALGFMLQNLKKNIICTTSKIRETDIINKRALINKFKKEQGGLSLRSNLINSMQVMDYKLPSPAIMFGTRLVPAIKVDSEINGHINLFKARGDNYWGRVDFGINIKSGLSYSKKAVDFFPKIQSNIFILEDIPGIDWFIDKQLIKRYQAVLIKLKGDNIKEDNKIKQIRSWGVPVILYSENATEKIDGTVVIFGCTWSVAIIKTMWSVANFKNPKDIYKNIEQDRIGEF